MSGQISPRRSASAQKAFDNKLVPVQVPLGEGGQLQGVIDLIRMRALVYRNDLSGSVEETDIPDAHQELASASIKANSSSASPRAMTSS